MATDLDHEFIISMLQVLMNKSFLPHDLPNRSQLEKEIQDHASDLLRVYEEEKRQAELKDKASQERKDFDKNVENLAKALPNITKGTLTAIVAFKKEDYFTGTAALLDICAVVASTAGGPPGMLVGAILGMIGQILSFFAPRSPSLTEQIETVMRTIQAEAKKEEIEAVHRQIADYAETLRLEIAKLSQVQPQNLDKLNQTIGAVLQSFNPGHDLQPFWKSAKWLTEKNNRDLDDWPAVLAAVCHAYSELLITTATLFSLANAASISKQIDEAELTKEEKAAARASLTSLEAVAQARLDAITVSNRSQLAYLKAILPTAQNRGTFWQIDTSGRLRAGTSITNADFKDLRGEHKRIAVAVARTDVGVFHPTYHILALEPSGAERNYHGVTKSPYNKSNWYEMKLPFGGSHLYGATDIWAIPGADPNRNEVYFYVAKGNAIHGFVLEKKDEKYNVRHGNYAPTLQSKVISVRVVRDLIWFADDPDVGTRISSLKSIGYVTYGGQESSRDIYVDASGKNGHVPSPWDSYSGLGVDEHYLWVFGSAGFACTTHASVMGCLNKEREKPRWMIHYPNEILYSTTYEQDQRKVKGRDRSPLQGLVDLCPCDDGTLVAALYTRSVVRRVTTIDPNNPNEIPDERYVFSDSHALYSAVYQTNLREETIGVRWTKLKDSNRGATRIRVQKLPVFCWPLYEGLMEALKDYGKLPVKPSLATASSPSAAATPAGS